MSIGSVATRDVVAREVEELADDPVHLLDVGDHAGTRRGVAGVELDAEAQSRQRRAQVVRNAREQYRAVALDLAQVAEHRVEPAVDGRDFGRAGFGQRRRRFAATDALDGELELVQRTREVARKRECRKQHHRDDRRRPAAMIARGDVLGLRAGRQREADPVAVVARLHVDEELPRARRDADLGAFTEPFAQALLQALHRRADGRDTDRRTLALGNDPHAVFASESRERLAPRRSVGAFERCAKRLHLHELRIVELVREQCRAIVVEQQERCQRHETDDGHQQQDQPAEQRARPPHHPPSLSLSLPGAIAASCSRVPSGTYT